MLLLIIGAERQEERPSIVLVGMGAVAAQHGEEDRDEGYGGP